MKLFALRHVNSHAPVSNLFFQSKVQAKTERDRLNTEEGQKLYVVTPGPDHRKFKK